MVQGCWGAAAPPEHPSAAVAELICVVCTEISVAPEVELQERGWDGTMDRGTPGDGGTTSSITVEMGSASSISLEMGYHIQDLPGDGTSAASISLRLWVLHPEQPGEGGYTPWHSWTCGYHIQHLLGNGVPHPGSPQRWGAAFSISLEMGVPHPAPPWRWGYHSQDLPEIWVPHQASHQRKMVAPHPASSGDGGNTINDHLKGVGTTSNIPP